MISMGRFINSGSIYINEVSKSTIRKTLDKAIGKKFNPDNANIVIRKNKDGSVVSSISDNKVRFKKNGGFEQSSYKIQTYNK